MAKRSRKPNDPRLDSYKVGYGRPPQHSKFRPGQSGNPRGRPKVSKTSAAIWADGLSQKIKLIVNGRTHKVSVHAAIILKTIARALDGDVKAVAYVLSKEPEIKKAEREKIKMITPGMSAKEAAELWARAIGRGHDEEDDD